MHDLAFAVNGEQRSLQVEPRELLIDVLRNQLGLTGTKRSCDVQVCGACTVLVDGQPTSACSTLAVEADGCAVQTIEGLAKDGRMDRIQQAFLDHGALQCGFCTPGFVMAVHALLTQHEKPDDATIRHYLHGNICRCTGYVKIIEAVKSLV
ncbi:MAG: (2Fe-2S)-binding protein [Ferrovibrio sp.]|nr:(2Fe-2S)-binding protein [Ferrovibrio sp.]